ncbi:hypothetical protein GCM10017562_30580 [Streptomyces roseofulvus]|uniref:Integral membrane protein n=2 Tax=Streptomyces TaxID=1883 RepID=A0ABU4K008_9ACTN|nr:hypothetical protein [Streptomyces roseolus]MDX2291095.1 hypothetical protein [Streptomyces roseolus]
MTTPSHRARAAVASSGWVALAATLLPDGSVLRWPPVLLFVCLGPGLALLHPQPRGLRPGARLEAFALAAPLSLALAALTATVLFLIGGFSVPAFLVPLAVLTTAAALLPGLPLPAATRGAVEPDGAESFLSRERGPGGGR